MKRAVKKLSEAEVLREFPIVGQAPGWFFRQAEVSNGAYVVEGTDLWGRRVSRQGADPEALLSACQADAQNIARQIGGPGP